ncbi:MAG: nucleotidyltransferase domain-containing protein [Clostridiales Family XIII bacterium]|jgi:predicted nucleotidyltransferase|nr:nucleotidyltransferase domain-containing protein [Clostridiales Family XIII bacterium]
MLTHGQIVEAVTGVKDRFALTKASYFGSYASGKATDESDLDVLVEFATPYVSILRIIDLKNHLEDALNVPVDVIHAPVPKDAVIEIEEQVRIV